MTKNQHRERKWHQESSQHFAHSKERIPAIKNISEIELTYLKENLKWKTHSQTGSLEMHIEVHNIQKQIDKHTNQRGKYMHDEMLEMNQSPFFSLTQHNVNQNSKQ